MTEYCRNEKLKWSQVLFIVPLSVKENNKLYQFEVLNLLFKGVEERFLKNFEVSPDGSFMLLTGTSGYLHLLSMKVVSLHASCSFSFLVSFSF